MNKQEFLETYIADRHNTNCSKWDGLKEKFGEADLLPMWVQIWNLRPVRDHRCFS